MVQDPVLSSLPDYQEKMYFSSGGFQDFTDYAKYTFDNMDASVLEANPYFIPVTSEDKKEILSYIENFENWVAIIGDDLAPKYDFDKSAIAEGDYFYIQFEYTYDRRFQNYDVYFFDVDLQTLFYFHNNI